MKIVDEFPHQVKIYINKHEFDAMKDRPWIKWCKENLGDYNSKWISNIRYDPEFHLLYCFKYEVHAIWFKMRFG